MDNGIQDSSKIEVNNMKIDFCKVITPNKIQITLKQFAIIVKNPVI